MRCSGWGSSARLTTQTTFSGLDRNPDALGRGGHVEMLDSEGGKRVDHGIHEGRGARCDAGLAAPFHAQRITLGRIFRELDIEGRKMIGARHGVIEKAR